MPKIAWVLFGLLSAIWIRQMLLRPIYNWDLIPYIGAALALDGTEPDSVHARTYRIVRGETPAATYEKLTNDPYRQRAEQEPDFFEAQLVMYRTKPLYLHTVRLLHGLGVPYVRATYLIAAVSSVLLAGILLAWIAAVRGPWLGLAVVELMLVGKTLESARLSSPDLAAAVFVLLGFCLLYFGRSAWFSLGALLVASLFRLENVVLLGLLSVYQVWCFAERQPWPHARQLAFTVASAAVGVAAAFVLCLLVLDDPVATWQTYRHVYEPAQYLDRLWTSYAFINAYTFLPLLIALAIGLYARCHASAKRMLVLLGIVFAIRFAVVPVYEDRFFVGLEWAAIAVLVVGVAKRSPEVSAVTNIPPEVA